jgi:hypothetical protein
MTVEALCAERAEECCNINWLAGSPGGFAELFKIGIGPSSSPAIGSMRVVDAFLDALRDEWPVTNRIKVTALGSLAWTAAAMAAGGLVSAPGGTNGQIENPDEIAIEHHPRRRGGLAVNIPNRRGTHA